MAGGNKKKKKPAANPARGFATTSVASKPKVEAPVDQPTNTENAVTPSEPSDTIDPAGTAQAQTSASDGSRGLHELSPEELEAQLEASELQQFVEHHGAKVKKESTRQVARLQADKRILRSQADFLSMKDWLPDELMQQVLELASSDSRYDLDSSKKVRFSAEDDATAKVWMLRQCLLNLDIPLSRVNEVLAWLVAHPPATSVSSPTWGIDECLEWLAIHCGPGELDEYDYQRPRAVIANEPAEELSVNEPMTSGPPTKVQTQNKQDSPLQSSPEKESTANNDIDVSELDSDLEPDELLQTWLKTKKRLYELSPVAGDTATKKGKGAKKADANAPVIPKSKAEQSLEKKLARIESDVLFDQRDAEEYWSSIKIDLVREAAERRKLQLQNTNETTDGKAPVASNNVNEEAEKIAQELLKESADDEGDFSLGGMFDSLPGVEQSGKAGGEGEPTNLVMRDFGKVTGVGPKRVLEEACKARDGRCKLTYKHISETSYSCRHSLGIQWNKPQESYESSFLPQITIKRSSGNVHLSMVGIATPDLAQSEAYIATIALFLIFAGSPKEEKAHLRLPASYRDLWDELTKAKLEYIMSEDGVVVKDVRRLITGNRNVDDEDDDEVVFNANSRRRNDAAGSSTPVSRPDGQRTQGAEFSEQLQQLWARKFETSSYQRMLLGRQTLPMYQFKTEALDTIRRHQAVILCGETGCGKSTQLPAFILEDELSQGRPCKIYCTEPRRISAISLAQRVSEEMGEGKGDLGTNRSLVGYAIRLESQTSSQTRLVYATVGIVLRMLENADGLNDITHLVIDEVHERSIDTDFLLIVLRSLMARRPDLKVVLMSATVDAQRFSSYLDGAPIINVPGRTFPVQAYFLEDAIELTGHTNEDAASSIVDDDNLEDDQPMGEKSQALEGYSRKTQKVLEEYDEYRIDYSLIVKLLENIGHRAQYQPFSKAILVFLPGIAEIRQLNDMLGGHPRFNKGWRVHPLHSSFSSEDQQAAFEVPPPGIRKIVLATNIAETGITIPDVTCVIDTGKHKEMRFDERRQMSRLIQSFIARANAKQRRGRAGRVQEGICFHLFTKFRHDQLMVDQQTPEMLRLSLQDLVMRVKICKLGDIEHALAQALDPPSSKNIRRAIDALVDVGALTTGEELTPLGSQLAKLPLDAQLGKLILLGSTYGCLDFALTAAATLSSKSPFVSPMHQKKQADTVRLGFKRGDSDLLTAYNAYSTWRKICQTPGLTEYAFCNKNFLSPQNLANIEDLKAQLLSSLVDAGFVQLNGEERHALSRLRQHSRQRNFVLLPSHHRRADDNDLVTTSVIAWSFYPKIIKQDGKGWRNVANNQSLALHPTSVNKSSLSTDVKCLSFYSIMQSSSRFTNAQETSAVADVALALVAGEAVFHLYAGVIVIDGNRLRFKVRDWRTMAAVKILRSKLRDAMAKSLRNPGRDLGDRPRRWMSILEGIFERLKPAYSSVQIR